MKQLIYIFIALISFGSFAQNLPVGNPAQLGLSKEGLARVDALLAQESENQHIPDRRRISTSAKLRKHSFAPLASRKRVATASVAAEPRSDRDATPQSCDFR